MTATGALFVVVTATSLGLGVLAVARPPRSVLRWSFAAGMAGFAAEALERFPTIGNLAAIGRWWTLARHGDSSPPQLCTTNE